MKSPRIFSQQIVRQALRVAIAAFPFVAGGCSSDAQQSSGATRPQASKTGSSAGSNSTPVVASSPDESAFGNGDHRPATAKTLFSMARILETQGKDSEAEYVLHMIVTKHPEFMPAYCDLSETLLRQRRIDEARQVLRSGLTRSPKDAVLLNDLGMCEFLRDDLTSALNYFTRAAALAPDDARYRSNMAVALGMSGRYAESLALYKQVVPEADAHYNLGVLCDARHDKDRAIEEYREAQTAKAAAGSQTTTADGAHGAGAAPTHAVDGIATTRPTS